jgi:hypothetical protein
MKHLAYAGIMLAVVASAATAQEPDKLAIHGYLTQAYAIADTGSYLGIPSKGTTNYRTAALQFRYAPSAVDNITIQVSHRRLGDDATAVGEAPVQLDWAFYGRRFGNFDVKVGRSPIPAGIYNELRDVGVALPLYRAPYNFYQEGSFTSETVDGVVAGYQTPGLSGWGLETSLYAGGWDMTERFVDAGSNILVQQVRVERALGGQLWLRTPIKGVRVGGGASRSVSPANAILPGTWKEWHGSLDARMGRVTLQSEYKSTETPDIDHDAWYVYGGVRVFRNLTLHAQADMADLTLQGAKFDFNDDYAAGASWAFSPSLVLKLEGHHVPATYRTDAPPVRLGADPSVRVNYLITSLSVSF